jgi:hypothetical protein
MNARKNEGFSETESTGSFKSADSDTLARLTRSPSAVMLTRRELAAMNKGLEGVEVPDTLQWGVGHELGVQASAPTQDDVAEFENWCTIPAALAIVLESLEKGFRFDERAFLIACEKFKNAAPAERYAILVEIKADFLTHGGCSEITIDGNELAPLNAELLAHGPNVPLSFDSRLSTAFRGVRNNLAKLIHNLVKTDHHAYGRIKTIVEQDARLNAARTTRKPSLLANFGASKHTESKGGK